MTLDVDALSDEQVKDFADNLLYYCGVMPTDYTYKGMPAHELVGGVRMALRQLAAAQQP